MAAARPPASGPRGPGAYSRGNRCHEFGQAARGRYNDPAMDLLWTLIDILLHLDRHLSDVIQQYGVWTYLILFLIVFCETGLVVTPFLPGDSLLFAVGTFAALGALDLGLVVALLSAAAILGDSLNYAIGARVGPRVFRRQGVRFLNRR